MYINFKDLCKTKDIKKVKELYIKAFPEEERVPFWLLKWKARLEKTSLLSIYDNEIWIGFIYLISFNDFLFILFFAIDERFRSKGYGSEVINKIKEMYEGYNIVLNTEVLDDTAPNYNDRNRRKKFYENLGFRDTGYKVRVKNAITFDFLLCGDVFEPDDFFGMMKNYVGAFLWFVLGMDRHYKGNFWKE
jgi:GNAT superfamily N-acetyltransferase